MKITLNLKEKEIEELYFVIDNNNVLETIKKQLNNQGVDPYGTYNKIRKRMNT